MADTTTAVYGWTMPEVGASSDTWGTKLNANLAAQDTLLGAVLSASGNKLTPTQILSSGAISSTAWNTGGIRAKFGAATLTDTSSSGTVAAVYADAHKAATLAASSVTTYTAAYGCYFEAPVAGTNVTLTAAWALGCDSLKVNGALSVSGHCTIEGVTSAGAFGSGKFVFANVQSWTGPTDASGASLSLTLNNYKAEQIGDFMEVLVDVTYPSTASGAAALLGNLPVTVPAGRYGVAPVFSGDATLFIALVSSGSANIQLYKMGAGAALNSDLSGYRVVFNIRYFLS